MEKVWKNVIGALLGGVVLGGIVAGFVGSSLNLSVLQVPSVAIASALGVVAVDYLWK